MKIFKPLLAALALSIPLLGVGCYKPDVSNKPISEEDDSNPLGDYMDPANPISPTSPGNPANPNSPFNTLY